MRRRQVLAIPALALFSAATTAVAKEDGYVEYTAKAYNEALESGKPFMLDFYASW